MAYSCFSGAKNSCLLSGVEAGLMYVEQSCGGNDNIWPCSHCGKMFFCRASLKKHVHNIHGSSCGPFLCAHCGRTLKNKNSLNAHIYSYHKRASSETRLMAKR